MGVGIPAPIIVSAVLGAADFAWADGLRREHFPPERNQLCAHLTMFHHLPPSAERELIGALQDACRVPAPPARLAGVMSLGGGVAFRIDSDALAAIRADLVDRFDTLLFPQDRAGWRPHITVQNKVTSAVARALHQELSSGFVPRPLIVAGLAAWWYRGGPWEAIGAWRFGGGHAMTPPG